jgi:glycosyltransferase involved in cell wall biosynthesis
MTQALKKLSLTIGIPAYNESGTVCTLLDSIFRQTQKNYRLEKIIVITDGSTDDTYLKVNLYAKRYSQIQTVNTKTRISKTAKLNYLYHINNSSLLLTLDADVVLAKTDTIDEMVKIMLADDDAEIVAGRLEPIKPNGFIPITIYTIHIIWNEMRARLPNSDHIANLYGAASLLRKQFSKSFKYPENITADEEFLYMKAKDKNGFRYAITSLINYRTVKTIREYQYQSYRSNTERIELVPYFGNLILTEHQIPIGIKFKAICMMILKNPIYTLCALGLDSIIKILPLNDKLNQDGKWMRLKTSKI